MVDFYIGLFYLLHKTCFKVAGSFTAHWLAFSLCRSHSKWLRRPWLTPCRLVSWNGSHFVRFVLDQVRFAVIAKGSCQTVEFVGGFIFVWWMNPTARRSVVGNACGGCFINLVLLPPGVLLGFLFAKVIFFGLECFLVLLRAEGKNRDAEGGEVLGVTCPVL